MCVYCRLCACVSVYICVYTQTQQGKPIPWAEYLPLLKSKKLMCLPGHWQSTPEFIVFHEVMPDIMIFGLFLRERSYQKSCLKNIVKIFVKNTVNWWKLWPWRANVQYLTGPGHSAAPEPPARSCLTVSQSIWQSYRANTCHLGLITHSVIAASAPSVSPTWFSAASLWSLKLDSLNLATAGGASLQLSATLDTQQNCWNTGGSLEDLFVFRFPAY